MPQKKAFLLRIDEKLYKALEQWAEADYRSVNSQIEYLLDQAVEGKKRAPKTPPAPTSQNPTPTNPTSAPPQPEPDDLDLSID